MGCLGFLCMGIGVGLMTGKVNIMMGETRLVPSDQKTIMGGILLGIGVLMMCVGAWKEIAERKEKRLKREATIDEEFAQQKRESIKMVDQEPAKLAGLPLTNPAVPETPALAHIGRIAGLYERGALDDDEFVAFKRPYLAIAAPQPTEREVEGLAHIERLADLWEAGTISDEEFVEQKQNYIKAMGSGANHLELAEGSKPKAPSSWDDLGEP
jgi:hypothetical protein